MMQNRLQTTMVRKRVMGLEPQVSLHMDSVLPSSHRLSNGPLPCPYHSQVRSLGQDSVQGMQDHRTCIHQDPLGPRDLQLPGGPQDLQLAQVLLEVQLLAEVVHTLLSQ